MKRLAPTFLALLLFSNLSTGDQKVLVIDDFSGGLGREWEVKSFKGETAYCVKDGALEAVSRGAASALIRKIDFDPAKYPVMRWRWKIEKAIASGDETKKSGDDYAARVYVIFPHWLFFKTRTLNYIWANKLPKGERLPNAFYSGAVMFAVESGNENAGKWMEERRDIVEDYRAAFGEDPPMAGAVAVMTDTDNTGESAVAFYDDIMLAGRDP